MLKKYLIALVAILVLFVSCTEDDNNPINPGEWGASGDIEGNNQSLNINYGGASYDSEDNETFIILSESNSIFNGATLSSNYIGFYFTGAKTGTFNIYENASMVLNGEIYTSTDGSVTITEYGAYGEQIKGDFEISFVSLTGKTETMVCNDFTVILYDDNDFDDNDFDIGDDSNEDLKNFVFNATEDGTNKKIELSVKSVNEAMLYYEVNTKTAVVAVTAKNVDDWHFDISATFFNISDSKKEYASANQEVIASLTINSEDKVYYLDGIAKFDKWRERGELIKFTFTGRMILPLEETGITINNFEFEVKRTN